MFVAFKGTPKQHHHCGGCAHIPHSGTPSQGGSIFGAMCGRVLATSKTPPGRLNIFHFKQPVNLEANANSKP